MPSIESKLRYLCDLLLLCWWNFVYAFRAKIHWHLFVVCCWIGIFGECLRWMGPKYKSIGEKCGHSSLSNPTRQQRMSWMNVDDSCAVQANKQLLLSLQPNKTNRLKVTNQDLRNGCIQVNTYCFPLFHSFISLSCSWPVHLRFRKYFFVNIKQCPFTFIFADYITYYLLFMLSLQLGEVCYEFLFTATFFA